MVKIIIALVVGAVFGFSMALLPEKNILRRELLRGYHKAVSDMLRWNAYYDKDGVRHVVKVDVQN